MFMVQKAVSKYGEMLIAPVLIIIGIFMLDIIKLNLPKINIGGESLKKKTKGGWGAMLLGVLFALAFCPTSGVFYFGMLIPLSAAETGGYAEDGTPVEPAWEMAADPAQEEEEITITEVE